MHEATIYNWESNRKSPQLRFIPRIIEFLGYVPDVAPATTLGERIITSRRLLGLSQREIANRLGIDPSMLGRWERGEGRPSWTHRIGLRALLADETISRTPET